MAANRALGLQVVDPVLTTIARLYEPKGFIYNQLVSRIPVSLMSGLYPVFDDAYWLGSASLVQDAKVKDRAPSKEVDFEWSTEAYVAAEYALKVSLTDLERAQAHPALRLERNKTRYLERMMQLVREVRLAALLNTIDAGGELDNAHDATPSTNWDQDTATIEADLKSGVLTVYDAIGNVPNALVIPYKVAYAMAVQEDIRAILQYQITGQAQSFIQLGSRVLPNQLHGMNVIIPTGARRNVAREGAAKSVTEIWGDEVRALYIDADAGWGEPATVYKFEHTAPTITRWSIVDPDVDYIREKERVVEKVVAPTSAFIWKDVLS
jgi:hypothetical protein